MQELMLVSPGARMPRAPDTAALRRLAPLRWRRCAAPPADWREAVAERLGIAGPRAHCVADVVADAWSPAAGGDHAGERWLLTPLHLVAGLDRVLLPEDGLLRLSDAHWSRLAEDFTARLGQGALRLRPVPGGAALLEGARFGALRTLAPDAARGRDLRALQPAGEGAARWRALLGEIELWLHEHPVNRERQRAGLAAVTSLWLWGGPAPPSVPPGVAASRAGARSPAALVGDDPWLAALPRRHGAARHVLEADYATAFAAAGEASDAPALGVVLLPAGLTDESLREHWLAPAQQALATGRIARLTLHRGDAAWQVARADRWRLWRAARDWQEVLGMSDE